MEAAVEKAAWKYAPTERSPSKAGPALSRRYFVLLALSLVLFLIITGTPHGGFPCQVTKYDTTLSKVQQCAIDNLHTDLSFLDTAKPITSDEFIERRDRLAKALAASNVDAFALEPGYTFQYDDYVALITRLEDSNLNLDTMGTSRKQIGNHGSQKNAHFSCSSCPNKHHQG